MNITALFTAFFTDQRTLTLFGLIVIDLVTGVIAALRTNTFQFGAIGTWYRTNVLPYVLGYLLVYIISQMGIASLLGALTGDIAATIGAGPAVLNLVASIGMNLEHVRAPAPVSTTT